MVIFSLPMLVFSAEQRANRALLVATLLLVVPTARAQAPLDAVGVFPNPAHIRTTVQVPSVPEATRATVTLSDRQGTVVFEQPVSLTDVGGTAEVPLLGWAPGLYHVLVQAGDQRVTRTLKVE